MYVSKDETHTYPEGNYVMEMCNVYTIHVY